MIQKGVKGGWMMTMHRLHKEDNKSSAYVSKSECSFSVHIHAKLHGGKTYIR